MLRYLRIFSWFLLTFGVVGFGATAFEVDTGIGTGHKAMGVLALQTLTGLMIYLAFQRYDAGRLDRKALIYGGWSLVVLYVVVGAIWMNVGG